MYCPQLIDNPMHPQFHPSLGWNMGEEAFNNASLRVLFVFPSGMGVRVVSATHQALYNIVKEKYGDDVFVDICMLPVDSYRNKYFKHYPAIAGYFSKHTIEDFEVVGCSVAITMTEVVELPIFLNRAGFNVDHKSRMADDKAPLLVVGGVAADGQSYLDSVVDLVMLGAGERTIPFLLDKVFEGQSRYGTVGKAKEWIIGACTGVKGFYNPHIYNYKHDVVDGKWQSEYLGCDIPDLETPHHDNDLPAEVIRVNDRQLRLPLPGAEQHKLSLQSSFGCGGAASQCTFCKEGWDYGCYASHTPVFTKRGMLQIKDVQVGDEVLTHKGRFRKVTRLWRHGPKEFVPVTLMGEEIHTTLSHKWYTSDSDNAPEFKPIESNPEAFKVYLPLLPKGSVSVDKGIAFLTGLYLSDGNLVHRVDTDTFDGLTVTGHSDYVDLYLKTFKDLGLPEPTVSHNTDKSAVTYYFSNSHNLHTAILQYIVPTDTKTGQEKDLLDCVLSWDDESAHYLILGYFFGDGTIKQSAWAGPRDYQYNVSLYGTCTSLMNKLHLLCGKFYTSKLLLKEHEPIRKDMWQIRFDTYSTVKFLNFAGDLALAKLVKVHPSFLAQDMSQFPRKPYGTHTEYGIAKDVRKSRAFHYDLAYTDESYDLEVEEDHSYTVGYNKFIVSNSWRERDDDDLYAGVRKAKATSFADGMSFFSFNSSFRSNYVGDLEYAAKYFNNLTALNFRMDSIAGSILHDPENNIARLVRFLGATTFACLHGSTLIETKRGLIPIEQVQVGDEVISLDYDVNKRGGRKNPRTIWSKVTHVLPRGKKPLYRFKTYNGHSLIATLDHVLPHTDTNRVDMYPDREIKDLIGRYLLTKDCITPNSADNLIDYSSLGEESPRRKYHRPERITSNLALLLGWLMGDGYVTDKSARFVFGSSDHEAFELVKAILDSEEIPYSLEQTSGVFGVCDRINVNSLSFADFVYAMGLRGVSSDKSFPTQIYTSPTECQLAFLRGYFSADGRAKVHGANPSSKTISVSTISESILNGVATLLNHLGIKNRPTYLSNRKKHHLGWNIKPIWELNIKGRDSWRVFADNVGFIQTYKQSALSGLSSGKKTQATVKLESYEYYGEDECWDLTIEGNPYFLANGIFVHNCPIEGVSQRLRNWLNKNLTEEDILIVVNEVFKNRYTRYKMGVIWTGHETKDDFEECYDLLRRMVDIRDTSGGNTQITFNCCLEASTLVNTTRGLVRADEIVSGDYVLNKGEPKKVLSTCITPAQSGYKITTKHGYSIEVNGEHPFQTVQKVSGGTLYWDKGVYKAEPNQYIDASFVKAQDLKVGDKVRLAPANKLDIPNHLLALFKYDAKDNRVVELDVDLAECLGWIASDVCLKQLKHFSGTSETFRPVAVFSEEEYSLSSQSFIRFFNKNNFPYREITLKGVHYLHADTTFFKMVFDLFGGVIKSPEKSVPSLILQSSLEVQAGFLRGLFSCNSYCITSRKKSSVTLVTISSSLAKTVQIMLLNFGIKSKIEKLEHFRLPSGRLTVSGDEQFNLKVQGNSFVTFVNEIGFNNQKQEKALASVGNSWCERYWSLYGFDTIVSIERTSEKQYYGHEVEGHVYETDGFVTHNTSLVHSWGTPLYYVPRKSTYLQWLNHFSKIDNKPFYYYPWMPVVDLGIKVNASSHPVDTIIQQALVDMPGEFLCECWLKPSLEGKMASRSAEQVRLLREGMERYGIDPKKQYLEYDPLKNPHQHMTPPYLVGAAKTVSGGDLTKYAEACSKTERGLGSCLVTPATLEKNNLTKCLACGSCPGVDKTRKQFGLKSDLPHLKWMQTRKINVKYTFEDVKTTILVNKPSFYYTFVFKVPKSSKLIANELLVRRFFVHANTIDESLVDNFRNINYSFFNTVDYSGLTPNYHGYEVVQVGFRDRLDEDKFTAIWKQTNDLMGGAIQLVKWFPSQESGSNNYLALYELDFNLSMEDFPKVVECLENEQWAWYESVPVNPETFDLPFRYKVVKGKEGSKLFVLVRPRVNVGYSIGLRLWTYPTIHQRLADQKIRAVFQESNGQLIDVVTGKIFDVSGFKQIDKGDSSIATKVYEPEIGGA